MSYVFQCAEFGIAHTCRTHVGVDINYRSSFPCFGFYKLAPQRRQRVSVKHMKTEVGEVTPRLKTRVVRRPAQGQIKAPSKPTDPVEAEALVELGSTALDRTWQCDALNFCACTQRSRTTLQGSRN